MQNLHPSDPFVSAPAESPEAVVQSIFNVTKCYDLMQNSSKGTVFETTIPFQLAFFALIEHDTDLAPLWDPERRTFVGIMTVSDYIQSLRFWRKNNLKTSDLTSQTLASMLQSAPFLFRHTGFVGIDAEDTVLQMFTLLTRTGNDYVPVIDAENGNLVSLLGFLDIVHLLNQAGKQHREIFSITLQDSNIGTYRDVLTAPKTAKLTDVLDALEQRNVSGVPVLDENQRVIGFYHRSDVSFIIKANDPDAVIYNLGAFVLEQSLSLREQLLKSGEIMSSFQGLVLVHPEDSLSSVLNAMVMGRSCRVVVVDPDQHCLGIVSIKDIVKHFLPKELR